MAGRNKLLIKINGKPMIRKVVESALNSKVDEVIVVLGWDADKIREALAGLPCRLIVNKDYEQGQSSSIKTGLKEVGNTAKAVLVLPGDLAKIDSHLIDLVVDEYNRRKAPIVVAAHNGRPGHPILMARELFAEIERIDEQTFGLKSVVKRHESEMLLVEAGSENVLRDFDTPEDLNVLNTSSLSKQS